MKIFKSIKDEFVYGGHIMSLGAASLVGAYSLVLGYRPNPLYMLIIYLGVHSIYLFDRYKEVKSDIVSNPERAAYMEKHRALARELIAFYLLGSFSLIIFFGGLRVTLYWFLMYALGFAYGVYFKKLSKKIVGFKDFFVSFVYLIMLFSYHAYTHIPIAAGAVLLMMFAYLRLFSTEIFGDLKDVADDRRQGLKTLAVVLKRNTYFVVINVINLLSAIPLLFAVLYRLLPGSSLVLLALLPYYAYYTQKSKIDRSISHLSYIYCDGEYMMWLPLMILVRQLWRL